MATEQDVKTLRLRIDELEKNQEVLLAAIKAHNEFSVVVSKAIGTIQEIFSSLAIALFGKGYTDRT